MSGRFEGRKLIAVGGSSGMDKENAADVVSEGGSAVIIGRDKARVDETVAELSNKGHAVGITADRADRTQDRHRRWLQSRAAVVTLRRAWAGSAATTTETTTDLRIDNDRESHQRRLADELIADKGTW